MTSVTRLLRFAASGLMLLGALTLMMAATAMFRDGSFADWVPNMPSSPAGVIGGCGALVVGALLRRRLRRSAVSEQRLTEKSKPTRRQAGS